jgi:hypothetical protein
MSIIEQSHQNITLPELYPTLQNIRIFALYNSQYIGSQIETAWVLTIDAYHRLQQ